MKLMLLVAALLGVAAVANTGHASAGSIASDKWVIAKNPKVVVITIHGGAWFGGDPSTVNGILPQTKQFSGRNQAAAVNIDYRSGSASLSDVISAYDRARKRYPKLPICAAGYSAGGNLALLLANNRKLDCVIAEAAPTDISTVSPALKDIAVKFFGAGNLKKWSPVHTTNSLTQPTILVSAVNDTVVYNSQAVEFAQKFPKTQLITLNAGNQLFIHSFVVGKELVNARAQEYALVRQVSNK